MRALSITLILAGLLAAGPVCAQHARLGIGTSVTESQIAAWNIDVRPDGTGLPPGQGSVEQGEKIFAAQCAACHGNEGQNPAPGFDRLAGGKGTLALAKPIPTVGSYWPYATTISP